MYAGVDFIGLTDLQMNFNENRRFGEQQFFSIGTI